MQLTTEQLRSLVHHPAAGQIPPRVAGIAPNPNADIDTQIDQLIDRYPPSLVATMLGIR